MRYLVTGGTSFIGAHLVRSLLERGCEVAVLMRPTSDPWRIRDTLASIRIISGDMHDVKRAAGKIREFAPEVMFHLAWASADRQHRGDAALAVEDVCGSLSLINVAHESGCQRWIGLGSQAEYGPHDGVLSEQILPSPTTTYGLAKLSTGLLAQKLCEQYRIAYVWLRLTAAYGPMDDDEHMIPYVVKSFLRGRRPAMTLGQQRWDYLFVDDVVGAMWIASGAPGVQGIYNLGSGEVHAVKSIAAMLRDIIDPRLDLSFGQLPYEEHQVMHLQADATEFRRAAGWQPLVPLEAGLRATVEWYKRAGNVQVRPPSQESCIWDPVSQESAGDELEHLLGGQS